MNKISRIPVKIESGQKYTTKHGVVAVKDGIKRGKDSSISARLPKPAWLKTKLVLSEKYAEVKQLVDAYGLSTVCEEAKCPNISECWSHGTATIMLMGAVCTRACRFCAVDTGNPHGYLDPNEPDHAALTVFRMNLMYVVLTSVNRDDLLDGGAQHYAKTIAAIKLKNPKTKIEALTPDFQGNRQALRQLWDSPLDVFAQNVETVERLTHPIRDIRAGYWQTIDLLGDAKRYRPTLLTKTSLMLGMGETEDEVIMTMDHLREQNVDILTLGQYLQPTSNHWPIERYVTPDTFQRLRDIGLSKGFLEVASGPMVRSSYRADRVFERDNLGL